MQKTEKVVHGVYALSIAELCFFIVSEVANYLALSHVALFVYCGILGGVLLVLGLFVFRKGLGLGLTLAGIWCEFQGSFFYWRNMTDLLRFLLASGTLLIIGYALYRLQHQKQGK